MASCEAAGEQRLTGRVAVFDLEWTAWEGSQARGWSGPGEEREIVEFGAVLLDAEDGLRETAAFEALVRPRINPLLSDYFTGLTGIRQDMVERHGLPFAAAFDAFCAFLGVTGESPPVTSALSFGRDPDVLRRNCELAGIVCPIPPPLFRNVRPLLIEFVGESALSACDLPRHLGFPAPADAHRALGDARCIAEALRRWHSSPSPPLGGGEGRGEVGSSRYPRRSGG